MRYAMPIQRACEMEPLINAGASEFYCGFQGKKWSDEYGSHDSLTRRQGAANIDDPMELKRIAMEANRLGTQVWLALNGRFTSEQWDEVLSVCDIWIEYGGYGIIVRDPTLMRMISKRSDKLKLAVSLLAVCLNRKSVEFWANLGATRIVLPRSLTISEIERITAEYPEIEFEAMVMEDGCLFIDGYCRAIHGNTYMKRDISASDIPRNSEADNDSGVIPTFDISGEAHHLCLDCYKSPGGACAACYIEKLEKAGVSVGKFGGRGTPLEYRLKRLTFLMKAITFGSLSERSALHRKEIGECNCYYDDKAYEMILPDEELDLGGEEVYAGHISCPGFLLNKKYIDDLKLLGGSIHLEIPPLPERFFDRAMELVRDLSSKEGLEVYSNDWGSLYYISRSFPDVSLSAGPLLLPQDTDPLIYGFIEGSEELIPVRPGDSPPVVPVADSFLKWQAPSEKCIKHWSEPSVFTSWELLEEMGVSQLEICEQPVMPGSYPAIPVSIYPASILSVLPCRNCNMCAALPTPKRGGFVLETDKNLIIYRNK